MKFLHAIVQLLLRSPKFPGRDYLIIKLPKWFLKKPKGPTIVSTRFGFNIKVDPIFDKNIENVIYERGVYEQGTVSLVQQILSPGDTFVDVGANIGFLSLVGASTVGKKGEVLAFEPVPSTYELLVENKELNGFTQLQTFAFAIGNEAGQVKIYPEDQNRGGASILNVRSEVGVNIEVKRLDDLVLAKKIDLIKIDVEGYELEVLKGAENKIREDKPVMIIEFSLDRENSSESMDMIHWINGLEIYELYRLKDGKERKSKLVKIVSKTGGLPQHDNIICIPTNN